MGMLSTKVLGNISFLVGTTLLSTLAFSGFNAPVLIIVAMSLASLGSALSSAIYFGYSMTYIDEKLKGSAIALSQSIRLLLTSSLVWAAAKNFNGSIQPLTLLCIGCAAICSLLYVVLYVRKEHTSAPTANLI